MHFQGCALGLLGQLSRGRTTYHIPIRLESREGCFLWSTSTFQNPWIVSHDRPGTLVTPTGDVLDW